MVIHFFTRWESGAVVAGITEGGKRACKDVFRNGSSDYVFTENGIVQFTESQQKAFDEFMASGEKNKEYFDDPLV